MPDRILIVDDDPLAVKLMKLSLMAEGFEVLTALDAKEGLLAVQTEQPDLILLDIMMPGIDGLDMCRQLRSRPQTAGIPIIFLTAKTQLDDKIAGLRAGADDYITKPADPKEVVVRIQAVLARTRRAPIAKQGQIISLIGAKGGVGTSTIAVNLGVALVQRKVSTLLIDLHHHAGTIAQQLKLATHVSLTELLTMESNQIDSQQIAKMLVRHSSGLSVLPSPPSGTRLVEIPPSHVRAIVRNAKPLADVILLDLPHVMSLGIKEALRLSDTVLLVLGPQLVDVACAEQLTPLLEDAGLTESMIRLVVVNRMPSAIGLSLSNIENKLHKPALGFIPPAAEELVSSFTQGIPLILWKTESMATTSLLELAERVHAKIISYTPMR